jgi:acyl carrier protein
VTKSKKVEQEVIGIVARTMNVSVDIIDASSSPNTIAAWDSIKHINLVLAVEDHFDLQLTDQQIMTEMLSVSKIVNTVCVEMDDS